MWASIYSPVYVYLCMYQVMMHYLSVMSVCEERETEIERPRGDQENETEEEKK